MGDGNIPDLDLGCSYKGIYTCEHFLNCALKICALCVSYTSVFKKAKGLENFKKE